MSEVGAAGRLSRQDALRVLSGEEDILELIQSAYVLRRQYFGRQVTVHILNNVQNGLCPEDCRYCAQSASSSAAIETYHMKSDAEIMEEARAAAENGAWRYCMVFSGPGPSDERVEHVCRLVRDIKAQYKIEVCVSPGVVTPEQAARLKAAGLDRLNHNLNTSQSHYGRICTTHSFQDRLLTLRAAKSVGLRVCSGVIIGMGEGREDVVEMAMWLRDLGADSIPVNFFMPLPGVALKEAVGLTPEYCLRVLCLFRFLNPQAEIRMAAGREMHLRSLEPLGLYVANSLFLQGYLNARGTSDLRTLRMLADAGFTIKSEVGLEELLGRARDNGASEGLKGLEELRPFCANQE
ncbi:MAG: biotin synthase BioB [Candidatus Omnitrophica bacterium]|nr:biotin synthase BioB [Candidatus Omnitrophota bacterium]